MVFLQAGANPTGPSGACFAHARSGTLALMTSPETVAEIRGLLARPNIRKKFPHLTDEVADGLIAEIVRIGTSIHGMGTWSFLTIHLWRLDLINFRHLIS